MIIIWSPFNQQTLYILYRTRTLRLVSRGKWDLDENWGSQVKVKGHEKLTIMGNISETVSISQWHKTWYKKERWIRFNVKSFKLYTKETVFPFSFFSVEMVLSEVRRVSGISHCFLVSITVYSTLNAIWGEYQIQFVCVCVCVCVCLCVCV